MACVEEVKGFVWQVAIVLAAGLGIGAYPVYAAYGPDTLAAALIGCAIATVNVIAGVISIVWASDKPQQVFMKAILGGMTGRMAAIFAILIAVVYYTELDVFPLVGSMFGFYLVFQILELRFVVRREQDSNGV